MSELTDKEMHDLRALQTMADKGFAAWTNENFMDVLDTFDEVQRIRGAQSEHISKLGKQIAGMDVEIIEFRRAALQQGEAIRELRTERADVWGKYYQIQCWYFGEKQRAETAEAKRDKLREKCDAAFTGLLGASRGECVAWGRKDRQPEIDKLREAWDKYGQHTEDCEIYFGGLRVCDCEYVQVRDAIEAALGEGGGR